jgi:asparagine synthase (glutamine-hydrolysing)
MFAFAIYDKYEDSIFFARDRLGIKPLLVCDTPQWFAFASELKAFLRIPGFPREIDYEALHHYLSLYAVPHPSTLFRNVQQIPAGHVGRYRNGILTTEQYWDITFDTDRKMDELSAIEGFQKHLKKAVSMRLMSEVPLGAFLSGGVDSSLVVATMADSMSEPVKTFSLGWGDDNGEFNETRHARNVAERYGTVHLEYTVTIDVLIRDLPRLVW